MTDNLTFVSGRKGDHAPFVPKWTVSGSVDYTHQLSSSLEGFLFLSYQGNDVRNTRFNPTLAANKVLPAYSVLNTRVGVSADRWSLELFIENLANSRGLTNKNYYPYSLTAMTQMEVVTPRTIGVDLSVKF